MGKALGFAQVGICDTDLTAEEAKRTARQRVSWRNGVYGHPRMMRSPARIASGHSAVISVRMDYLPPEAGFATNLTDPNLGYISRYAGAATTTS